MFQAWATSASWPKVLTTERVAVENSECITISLRLPSGMRRTHFSFTLVFFLWKTVRGEFPAGPREKNTHVSCNLSRSVRCIHTGNARILQLSKSSYFLNGNTSQVKSSALNLHSIYLVLKAVKIQLFLKQFFILLSAQIINQHINIIIYYYINILIYYQ